MFPRISGRFWASFAVVFLAAGTGAHALERVTYTNGLEDTFSHHEVVKDVTRFYKSADDTNWQEVKTERIASIIVEPDLKPVVVEKAAVEAVTPKTSNTPPTMSELKVMLDAAGEIHNVDSDLLASVAKIESGFHVNARSKVGARGLMQLMPGTAKDLGVKDVTQAEDNIKGGAAYLDQLLTQYHDDLVKALAAYNAGPAAVAKYHGIPPYRETQWYVVKVINEYNRRVKAREAATMVASR